VRRFPFKKILRVRIDAKGAHELGADEQCRYCRREHAPSSPPLFAASSKTSRKHNSTSKTGKIIQITALKSEMKILKDKMVFKNAKRMG
jgi:hypothetical protein